MPVYYFSEEIEVQLGDRVSVRVWCKRRSGRVVYVPGISPLNPEFEYNGLKWVGVRLENAALLRTIARNSTGRLTKSVRFAERDTSPCDFVRPDSREFEEHGEGLAP